jgi:hypothetical protein
MKKVIMSLAVASSSLFAQNAFSQEITWELVKAQSSGSGVSCTNDSVQALGAGEDMSLVFDSMNVNLIAGENTKTRVQYGTCYVFLKMTIPQGHSILANSSSLIGGITKDKGAYGYVDVVATMTRSVATPKHPFRSIIPIGPVLHTHRDLFSSESLNEPLFELSKSKALSTNDKKTLCKLTQTKPAQIGMFVQLSVAGVRTKGTQTNIIGIDTLDSRLDLALKAEACPAH